jgi:transposase
LQPLTDKPTIYLHREPVDFRKAVNGLMIIVEQEMELSPFDDALFVFCNKSYDKLKVLYWEQTGFCLWYKRLEKHKFKWPRKTRNSIMTLSEQQWDWLLSGLDITKMRGHQPLTFMSVR